MHIVHIVDKFQDGGMHGGLATFVSEHARILTQRGHRMTVLARRFSAHAPLLEEHNGIRIVRFESNGTADTLFASRRAMKEILASEQVDIINSHLAIVDLGALTALPGKWPIVRTFHGDWAEEVWSEQRDEHRSFFKQTKDQTRRVLQGRVEAISMHRAQSVIVLSEFSKKYVMQTFGKSAGDITVIPPGVNIDRFRPVFDTRALRRNLSLPLDAHIVLFAGRLIEWKGVHRLIRAFAELHSRDHDAVLVIAGDGSERMRLEQQVREASLENSVMFVGFQKELLPQYYAAADVLVVASTREETFGMVTAEALASGTPVLGTAFGATPEILRELEPRLIIPTAESADIAARLIDFFFGGWRENLTREKLVASAQARFSWDSHADRSMDFYRTLKRA